MSTKKIIIDLIEMLLALAFFYEGIYKIAYMHGYNEWLHHKPMFKQLPPIFGYLIGIGEVLLSLAILIPRSRKVSLYVCIVCLVLYIFYAASLSISYHLVCVPYHFLWSHPSWYQRMVYALCLIWISFIALVLEGTLKPVKHNSLRNTPANVN